MRIKREYTKTRNSVGRGEEERSARRLQLRHWLLLGAGAAGAAAALAKWALAARRDPVQPMRQDDAHTGDFQTTPLASKLEPLPMSQVGMPDSATPTNDARTPLVTPEAELSAQAENAHIPVANTSQSAVLPVSASLPDLPASSATNIRQAVPQTASPVNGNGRSSGSSKQKNSRGKKMDTSSPKRSKLSQDYDQALAASAMQANSLPAEGYEGERANPAMEAQREGGEPASSATAQAESKLSSGEELREREFPIPPQVTGAASQKLVVDQETMSDAKPRKGDTIGVMPGDRQNVGEVGDTLDQQAKTPDFVQQR